MENLTSNFVTDFDFSVNSDKVWIINGIKKNFEAFKIYPCDRIYAMDDGSWEVEIKGCKFPVQDDDFEAHYRERFDKREVAPRPIRSNIPDQNKEFENRGIDLDELCWNKIEEYQKMPETFNQKVEKFISTRAEELRNYFTDDNRIINMNPKDLFNHFIQSGGSLVEENGNIKIEPFYAGRTKEYYESKKKKVKRELRYAKFGNSVMKVYVIVR